MCVCVCLARVEDCAATRGHFESRTFVRPTICRSNEKARLARLTLRRIAEQRIHNRILFLLCLFPVFFSSDLHLQEPPPQIATKCRRLPLCQATPSSPRPRRKISKQPKENGSNGDSPFSRKINSSLVKRRFWEHPTSRPNGDRDGCWYSR